MWTAKLRPYLERYILGEEDDSDLGPEGIVEEETSVVGYFLPSWGGENELYLKSGSCFFFSHDTVVESFLIPLSRQTSTSS